MERTQKKWILFKHLKTSTNIFTYLGVGEAMLNLIKKIMAGSKNIFSTQIEPFPARIGLPYLTSFYKLAFPLSYILLKPLTTISGISSSFFSKKNNSTLPINKMTIVRSYKIYDHDNEQRIVKSLPLNKMNISNLLNNSILSIANIYKQFLHLYALTEINKKNEASFRGDKEYFLLSNGIFIDFLVLVRND